VAALVLAALLATAATAGVAACSSGSGGGQTSQTPAKRFVAILGHQPSGLAKAVAARGTLVVGEDPEFAPQSSVDSTGAWSGFDVDVAREVGAVLGLKVEFRQLDWARVPAALAADRYDVAISSMATVPKPPGRLAFAAPYAYSTAQVAVRQGSAAITTLGEIRGKSIGVSASTTFQQFLAAAGGVGVALYPSDADALPDVANGSLAGAMTADTTATVEQAAGAQIAATGAGFFYQPQAFAARRGEADFVAVLDGALKTMRRNGTQRPVAQVVPRARRERSAGRIRTLVQPGAGDAEGRDVPAAVKAGPDIGLGSAAARRRTSDRVGRQRAPRALVVGLASRGCRP
jgi:cystine transport system substrate-binding protein